MMFEPSIDDHLCANAVRVVNVVETENEKPQGKNHRNEVRKQQEQQPNRQRHRQKIARIARWILQHWPARHDRHQMTEHRHTIDQHVSDDHTAAVQRVDIVIVNDLQVSADVQGQENVALQEIEIVVENGFGIADDGAEEGGHADGRPTVGVEREEAKQQEEIGGQVGVEPLHGWLSHGRIGDELYPEEQMSDGGENAEIEERLDSTSSMWRPVERLAVGMIAGHCWVEKTSKVIWIVSKRKRSAEMVRDYNSNRA